ncbi:MAG TPA: hypothetical protein VHB45_09830 [Alloacidobacterium sp.]|nr:hypothetical protein [Alloacidobacterium sp.]
MDLSLDSDISKRVFKLDNDLAPFFKSVSFWALTGVALMILGNAFRHLQQLRAEGHLFVIGLLLLAAAGAYAWYIVMRISITRIVSAECSESVRAHLARVSRAGTVLCGLMLFGVLLACSL